MIDRIGSRMSLPPTRDILGARSAAVRRSDAPVGTVKAAPKVAPRSLPPSLVSAARDLAAAPPVDTARVASVKAAINSGSYRIDADAVADRMLALDVPMKRPAKS